MPKIKIKVVLTERCPICGSRQPITKKGVIRKHYMRSRRIRCLSGRSA